MKKVFTILFITLYIAGIFTGCSEKTENGSVTSTDPQPQTQKAKSSNSEKSNISERIIEPDELISKTEAEQLIGESLKAGERKDTKAVGMKLCVYNAVKEDTFKFLQVSITQKTFMPDNGQSPESIYKSIKDNYENAVVVEGIGNEAFIAPPGLHILNGTYYITIAIGNSDDEKNRETLKAAGKKAVENLNKLTK